MKAQPQSKLGDVDGFMRQLNSTNGPSDGPPPAGPQRVRGR